MIGSGAFGQVFRAVHKLENSPYAIKRIRIEVKADYDIKSLPTFREIQTMISLNHANIVRYVTSWLEQTNHQDSSLDLSEEDSDDIDMSVFTSNKQSQ